MRTKLRQVIQPLGAEKGKKSHYQERPRGVRLPHKKNQKRRSKKERKPQTISDPHQNERRDAGKKGPRHLLILD